MGNKTIVHLTGMFSRKYGAFEHYLLNVARVCKDRGYRTVLQYESTPTSAAYLSELEGLDAGVVGMATHTHALQGVRCVAAMLRATRPEIVHTHFVSGYVLLAVPFIARWLGVRKVIAGGYSVPTLRPFSVRRFALNRYDHVLVDAQAITDRLIGAGVKPGVVSTHYLGLFGRRETSQTVRAHLRREFGIPDEALVLGCLAFDNPIKGLDVLLYALSQVVRVRPDVHLIVVGV
ncbi:MAG TPA: hypothetical protein VFT43_07750, partial [Candidatus Polarisedimenticolia bacterium]|nr:hypothetical protein [Candidatus Polarisedimenticolia bacterium]